MPSPFDITTATNTVTLDNKREGVAVFTVRNTTRRRINATARLTTTPPEGAQWLTLVSAEGSNAAAPNQRDFPIDSTQQLQVEIAVPASAAPGSYTLKLTLADEVNPDENFTTSPDVLFTVREIVKPTPKPFPVWIIPVIVIAVLVIGAIIIGGVALSRPQPTPTPAGPCVVTIITEQLVYTRPEVDGSYIFDEARAGDVFNVVGRLANNSWWKTNYNDSWIQTSVFGTTAQSSGDCANLPIVFAN